MSVVHPYQPMTSQRIASEDEVKAMHAKLKTRGSVAQRSEQAPVEREVAGSIPAGTATSEAAPSPKEKAKLEWNKPTSKLDTAVKTKCGRYSCCKVVVLGVSYYEVWRLIPERKQIAKRLDNFLQAQVLAQQDADR